MGNDDRRTCPGCGGAVLKDYFENHRQRCDGPPAAASRVDGCPMCGQGYADVGYLTHILRACPAGDRADSEHAKISGPR